MGYCWSGISLKWEMLDEGYTACARKAPLLLPPRSCVSGVLQQTEQGILQTRSLEMMDPWEVEEVCRDMCCRSPQPQQAGNEPREKEILRTQELLCNTDTDTSIHGS